MAALLFSPIHYFRLRTARRPAWGLAFTPVIVVAGVQSLGAVAVFQRSQIAIADVISRFEMNILPAAAGVGIAVFSVLFGVVVVFWLSTGTLVALDLLFSQSGQARRLVEFSAIAYWSQVPWAVVGTGLMLMLMEFEPVTVPPGVQATEIPGLLADHRMAHAAAPLQQVMGLMGMYFRIWLAFLQACALRVVSEFSVAGTWISGIGLTFLFGVLPWMI